MIIRSIADILADRTLCAVAPHVSLRAACQALDEADVGALAVMEDGNLLGIISERDVIRRAICKGRAMDDTTVADIMTRNPCTVTADDSLANAMGTMVDGGFRHLPVTLNGAVYGMLSMRDIPTEYRLMFERYCEAQQGPQLMEGGAARTN